MPRGMQKRTSMWALRGMQSALVVLSPPPPRPKQEQEAPEESSILAVILHKVRTKGLFCLYHFPSPKGTAATVALGLG